MNIENFLKNNPELKKWMKWIGGIVFAIWIIREIFMMTMFNSMFHWVTGGIDHQEKHLKSMSQRSDEHLDSVAKGMQSINDDMLRGIEEMEQKMDKFQKDWKKSDEVLESLRNAPKHMDEFAKQANDYMKEVIKKDDKEFAAESKKQWDQVRKEEMEAKKQQIADEKKHDRESWERARQNFYKKTGNLLPDYEHHLNKNPDAG